jgi:hypothetical protein
LYVREHRQLDAMMAVYSVCLIVLSLLVATSSWAAQPLVTDDAAVVAAKTCQLEAWLRSTHNGNDYWAQPACNFIGNLELSIGGARTQGDSNETSSIVQLQAKTALSSRVEGTWSLGMNAGVVRDTGAPHGSSAFQLYYAKALASWYPNRDLEIDFNLGGANLYGSGTFALAGAAIQYAIVTNAQVLAEVFRDEPGRAKYQLGARYVVIRDRFETYVSYGNRFNGPSSQSWAVIGIRVQTPPFLR